MCQFEASLPFTARRTFSQTFLLHLLSRGHTFLLIVLRVSVNYTMQSMIFAFVACSLLASVSSFKMPSSLLKAASLKASPTHDAPGFDTHKAVETIPASLVKEIDGNDSMRKKMETLVRSAQVCTVLQI